MTKDVISQLIKLRILERSNAVTNHIQRFFGHKRTQGMFELRDAIKVDKKGAADVDNRVLTCQQADKIGKALGNGNVAQLSAVCHPGKQNLVLVATAQNLFHPPH